MQILEISIDALELAKQAAAGLPFPGLSLAIESALSMAKKAREIEDTRDECRALAERAATFVLTVYQQLKHGSGETAGKEHVTTFLHNLLDIENLMVRRLRAGRVQRILFALKRGKIAKEVKTLTAKLEESYRIFLIQSTLAIDQSMNTLTSGNIRMMRHIDDSARVGEVLLGETRVIRTDLSDLAYHVGGSATFDGDFRLFARENLALLEPFVDSLRHGDEYTIVQATARPPAGRVFRYRAVVEAAGNLTGTQVVVYEYPSRDDRQFVEAVKFAKRTRHPHLLAMIGYSRSGNPGDAAYIVTEVGRRYTQIGTATRRTYYTETIVFCTTETVVPPLWFFVFQFDGDSSAHDCIIPSGFWSLEKDPTSIPADTIALASPQDFVPLQEVDDQIFVTVQALGDFKSVTWTKMNTEFLQLSEDELSAFREFKEGHH
ncbi:uncharacterized protein TRAVEDRAFT_54273 [Trametes versicolor FP-101664 SS1]|uniref:Uncharacterized protein n=1 Tax=Trametes versicolor (strain FP-101664) TaxID=717944 RepID=R7S7B0_TRAVS|nr:uncharacterized protein TRAVEDRAFT_54273 [Trametes versicolor FP-101664 SS1]EIW51851.1 hypothetical protein TRAVEDRAFT_54273 [Trametes versicolor FP-101664 SS1]